MMPLAAEEGTDECSSTSELSRVRFWLENDDRPVIAVDERGVGEDVERASTAMDAMRHNVRTRRKVRVGITGVVVHGVVVVVDEVVAAGRRWWQCSR
jgi:hypothetical protein